MISECCYAEDRMVGPDGPDYSDILECPVCHEHAVFIDERILEKVEAEKQSRREDISKYREETQKW